MGLDYTVLRNELLTDPEALGYAPTTDTSRDVPIADLLNLSSTGRAIPVGLLPSYEIVNQIAWPEASTSALAPVTTIISAGTVDPTNTFVRNAFAAAFGSTTATRARLVALSTRPGSRAEALFGPQVIVEPVHVGLALRSA